MNSRVPLSTNSCLKCTPNTTTGNLLFPRWIERYFATNQERVMDIERPVFIRDRQNFIVPKNLYVRASPMVMDSVDLIGMLTETKVEAKSYQTLLVDGEDGEILAVDQAVYQRYGIPPSVCRGGAFPNVLNLRDIIKDMNVATLRDRSISGKILVIDTSAIPSKYFLSKDQLPRTPHIDQKKVYRAINAFIEVREGNSYNTKGLNIIEVRIKEALEISPLMREMMTPKNSGRRGVGGFSALLGPKKLQSSKIVEEDSSEDMSVIAEEEIDMEDLGLQDDNQDIQEIELMIEGLRADRERKLKEKRSLLNEQKIPTSLIFMTNFFRCVIVTMTALGIVALLYSLELPRTFRQHLISLGDSYFRDTNIANLEFQSRNLILIAKYSLFNTAICGPTAQTRHSRPCKQRYSVPH
jgi:hypothetical protein